MNILVFSIVWFKDSVYILRLNKLAAYDEEGATGKSPLAKLNLRKLEIGKLRESFFFMWKRNTFFLGKVILDCGIAKQCIFQVIA